MVVELLERDLVVLHNDNGTYIDLSKKAQNFLRDDFTIDFEAANDELLIGLYKKFDRFYVEVSTDPDTDNPPALNNPDGLVYAYSTASSFTTFTSNIDDDTSELERSGFIRWERNRIEQLWKKQTINGFERYWIKITTANDFAQFFSGINLVFSDDLMLKEEIRDIDDYLASGDDSFIAYHVSARNDIVQKLNNESEIKVLRDSDSDLSTTDLRNISKWDLLEAGQVELPAKYLALAKIMFDISENTDDKQYQRYTDYMMKFENAYKDYYMVTIDFNNDGEVDRHEQVMTAPLRIFR